jgi:hypothetical protein
MTVDIVRAENNALATLGGATDALDRLAAWVDAASNARRLVAPLVMTAFVPEAYKPRVDPRATDKEKAEAYEVAVANATAAVLQGLTLGIDPLMALQQIYIVHGRPGMYAKMMVALVQSHGHEVWTEEGECTDTRAVVYGRRRGTERVERVIVTMDMARKAGWTSNQAYTKTPQDMLYARAASRVCDRIASDVLKGIASVEAIQDELAPPNTGTRTVAPRQRQRPPIQATATVEPPLDDDEPAGPEPTVRDEPPAVEPTEPAITQAQQRKLHALLREQGLADRELGLARIAQTLGREVGSTKDLSKVDAVRVIDDLESLATEPPLDEPEWPDTPTIPGTESAG